MTSRRLAVPWYIQCLPSSLATTRWIVLLTPNGVPQRTQPNGSSSLSTRAAAVAARKSIRGMRLITFSGQVALHSPHCTQASSTKRNIGRSGSPDKAPVGQAETQARQSVQPSVLISTDPNGAPAGRATLSTGAGAARCSSRNASRNISRFDPTGGKPAGRDSAQHLSKREWIIGLDAPDPHAVEAKPGKNRLHERQSVHEPGDVMA